MPVTLFQQQAAALTPILTLTVTIARSATPLTAPIATVTLHHIPLPTTAIDDVNVRHVFRSSVALDCK